MAIRQTTRHLLMVRPAAFGYNAETAQNNAFQTDDPTKGATAIARLAQAEFDALLSTLSDAGVKVLVITDRPEPKKSDAVFPNNHISFHPDGRVFSFPMFSEVRRLERWNRIFPDLDARYHITEHVKLEQYEAQDRFLEGTGSMVMDHPNRLVYACRSIRTDEGLVRQFAEMVGYRAVLFDAVDKEGLPIYHTNVMMAVGETFVVICWEAIPSEDDRARLRALFTQTEKEVVAITYEQMLSFAGNMLQVHNHREEPLLVMSTRAYEVLNADQRKTLLRHNAQLLHSPLPTIEDYGGGSARCMIAEIFLKPKHTPTT